MDAGTDAAVDGGPDGGPDGGEPQGACDNESDLEALDGIGGNVREVARICRAPDNPFSVCGLISVSQLYEECVGECVEDSIPGLSVECASCEGALERCGPLAVPSCVSPCLFNGCSTLCLDCLSRAGCIEEYEDCRGIPGPGCP